VWIDDLELQVDNTAWQDVIAETATGALSTTWTPIEPAVSYKVRVRSVFDAGYYGGWDESDTTFEVIDAPADGDFDADGDVDLGDYAGLQVCFDQPSAVPCHCFDFDANGIVDAADYVTFEAELSGP
jgi:hypothetical protein